MRWMRDRVPHVAGAWLAFQLCLLASLPTPLCSPAPAGAVGAECTCGDGDGSACPMHHPAAQSHSTPRPCSCRSTNDPGSAILSLIGTAAVLSSAPAASTPASGAQSLLAFTFDPIESPSIPTSPPPRA